MVAEGVLEGAEPSVALEDGALPALFDIAVGLVWSSTGDWGCFCVLEGVSVLIAAGTADFEAGVGTELAGNEGAALGEVVALLFCVDGKAERPGGALGVGTAAVVGGGGSGAIPTAPLSFVAAAAAAEAYFRVSPGALVGRGAGFIALFVFPLDLMGIGVWRVARAGKGDFG